jgi:hypothetical protein
VVVITGEVERAAEIVEGFVPQRPPSGGADRGPAAH